MVSAPFEGRSKGTHTLVPVWRDEAAMANCWQMLNLEGKEGFIHDHCIFSPQLFYLEKVGGQPFS